MCSVLFVCYSVSVDFLFSSLLFPTSLFFVCVYWVLDGFGVGRLWDHEILLNDLISDDDVVQKFC